MIEKIYKNKYKITCDNCEIGQECDNWPSVMEFMREEKWKKRLIDREWKHYCPECQEIDPRYNPGNDSERDTSMPRDTNQGGDGIANA